MPSRNQSLTSLTLVYPGGERRKYRFSGTKSWRSVVGSDTNKFLIVVDSLFGGQQFSSDHTRECKARNPMNYRDILYKNTFYEAFGVRYRDAHQYPGVHICTRWLKFVLKLL